MSQNRTLSQIIEAVKDNGEVTSEELRLVVLAQDFLMSFDHRAISNLRTAELEGKTQRSVYSADWQFKERFRRLQNAMKQDPQKYLGEHNLPESLVYQKRRAISKALVNQVMANEKALPN
ncbi:hypothetical protein [Acinetobacter colistiniresistens]|uniref:hypothetical protein n=1 Tax=Acinetobacter colistiniresistens TaxID=280145 RepID=UPI0012501AD7|nr:hypothetical protein [Acinetobacter colistiniresistens]